MYQQGAVERCELLAEGGVQCGKAQGADPSLWLCILSERHTAKEPFKHLQSKVKGFSLALLMGGGQKKD